jgi:hypothetical protein
LWLLDRSLREASLSHFLFVMSSNANWGVREVVCTNHDAVH